MSVLEVESLMLDYPVEDVERAFRNSKKYFPSSFYYNRNVALSEYGSIDRLRMASLYYCVEQTGSLSDYSNQVNGFVQTLRKETDLLDAGRQPNNPKIRMSTFDFDILDDLFPPVDSAEDIYLQSDSTDPLIGKASEGIILLLRLTRKQREAVEVFSNTRSRKETARLLGTTPIAIKQLLQRARRTLGV